MKVCNECKAKGIKSCDHALAEGYGFGADPDGPVNVSLPGPRKPGKLAAKFKEILHPRKRGGEFRDKGFVPNKSGYSGKFKDGPHEVVGGSGRVVGTFPSKAQADDYAKLHPAYTSRPVGGEKKVGPRAQAVIDKHFTPSGKKFVPAKSGFGGTFEGPVDTSHAKISGMLHPADAKALADHAEAHGVEPGIVKRLRVIGDSTKPGKLDPEDATDLGMQLHRQKPGAVSAAFRDLAERGPVVRPLPRMPHER